MVLVVMFEQAGMFGSYMATELTRVRHDDSGVGGRGVVGWGGMLPATGGCPLSRGSASDDAVYNNKLALGRSDQIPVFYEHIQPVCK